MMNPSIPDLLRDLVSRPSVNPMGPDLRGHPYLEAGVTAYLEDYFRALNVPFTRQSVAPERENIVARFESPGATRTILWEVHQDTVPVVGMTIDPFAAEIRDGKLHGRGACDVKGGMTAMLTAFTRLVRERPAGAANVILACTVDEEHTFLGIQELMNQGIKADFAIVAEPTLLQIVDAHKGVARWKLRTEGRACHSSRPDQGINAIYRMGHVLAAIDQYAAELAVTPAHPRLGPPTLSVGRIEGGVSVNTVPDSCVIEIDRRLIPGESGQGAREHFINRVRELTTVPFVCDPLWMACPALDPSNSDTVRQLLGQAIDAVEGSHEVLAVPFGTDASTVTNAGIPAVVFGPGDIRQAHTKDEWIELAQIERAAEILFKLATI
ncbi:M20 family metallopeptidase [Zavarzinella formosa]|uniref:M20 family metallopeptidase n=1 Tax=Zavarzinella formosa TaxID=360055 RepID=UPI0002E1C44D|nr:M20 family metallopeptidase [Zavarzinella formosa]